MNDDDTIRVGAFADTKGSWAIGVKIPLGGKSLGKKKITIVPYREVDPSKIFTKEELASEALSAIIDSLISRK